MGNRRSRSGPLLPAHQADAVCELLVAMLQCREAARLARGHAGRFAASEFSLGVLRLAAEEAAPQCACADLGRLVVERIYASGSVPEGNDVHLREPFGRSDSDVMFQLGPIRGLGDPVRGQSEESYQSERAESDRQPAGSLPPGVHLSEDGSCPGSVRSVRVSRGAGEIGLDPHPPGPDTVTDGDQVSPAGSAPEAASDCRSERCRRRSEADAVLLTQEVSGRPGFVLLRHRRLAECRHQDQLLFSAGRAVSLLSGFGREAADGHRDRLSRAGPSLAVDFWQQHHIDLVACVRCPRWPSAEFASRRRPSGWPAADLVRRLCQMEALLVPVGARGTAAERHQWRLSFSRHEHAALRALTPEQRACLTALKYCKAALGRSAAAVKSYYLKTALLWLSEQHGADWWTGAGAARRALLAVLHWVEAAVRAGRLPCYFWPAVDALAGRGWSERRRLERHVATLSRHLLVAVVVLCQSRQAQWQRQDALPAQLVPTLTRLCAIDPASARQLRPEHYRAVLRGNGITLQQLSELMQQEAVWPDEQTIDVPPISMNNLLAGYLLANHGPRRVTCPRHFHR